SGWRSWSRLRPAESARPGSDRTAEPSARGDVAAGPARPGRGRAATSAGRANPSERGGRCAARLSGRDRPLAASGDAEPVAGAQFASRLGLNCAVYGHIAITDDDLGVAARIRAADDLQRLR